MTASPVVRYPGAKWMLADWIISFLPPHETFVEPFFGSGAVFFNKQPAKSEYINDLDGDIVNLFQVIRDRPDELAFAVDLTPWSREEYEAAMEASSEPVERARRTLIRHWMSIGSNGGARYATGWRHNGLGKGPTTHVTKQWDRVPSRILATVKRLKQAQIECRPALEILGRINAPTTLAYVDPPYHPKVRSGRMYRTEMFDDASHVELLEFLLEFRGMVVLSGYAHPLYDDLLSGWERVTRTATAEQGQTREEVLWINPLATQRRLHAERVRAGLESPLFGGTA